MERLIQNIRYAIRMLRKSPGFAAVAVMTLALGIGANTAIFSVVYPALLRPLPYRHAERLVMLAENRRQTSQGLGCSYPDYLDWKRVAKSFASLAGFVPEATTLTGAGESRNIFAAEVTPNFFTTLGVKPLLGRDFADGDDQREPAGPLFAILSYGFWQSGLGADPKVIGHAIQLDHKSVTIVGVLPADFEFAPANSAAVWVPLHLREYSATARNYRWLRVLGRLAPGSNLDQARAEMDGINAQIARAYPKTNAAFYVSIESLRDRIVGNVRPLLLILSCAVGFVLLIACANVANLLLMRSIDRRKEFAVRVALGASSGNLLSQLLTESLLLSFVGSVVGLLGALWGVRFLIAAIPEAQLRSMPYLQDARTNLPVMAFLFVITLITGILFGVAPSFTGSQTPVSEVLKDEARSGTSAGRARLRNGFVAAEIAICLILLVGAGLMLQSLRALLRQDPGFEPRNVLAFDLNLPSTSYPVAEAWPFDSPEARRFQHEFTERLRSLPGVEAAAAANIIPFRGNRGGNRFAIEGHPTVPGQEEECPLRIVSAGYFELMRMPLVAGRFFSEADTPDSPKSMMVNQAFVKRYLSAGEDPIGKRLRFTYSANEPYRQIVGIIGDAAEDNLAAAPPATIYIPFDQFTVSFLTYVVRTSGDPALFVSSVRDALRAIDPQLALAQPQSLEQIANQSPAVFLRRYPSYLIGSFAALALILAMVGLYGLIAYAVLQRTREIGIRMALGAQRDHILWLVLRQGMSAVLAGVGIGIVAGLGLTRLMASLLYGVKASDGFTFASVAVLLMLVALAASSIPARRATKVDPMVALRYE